MPISAKRLLERSYREIDEWARRRDAVYKLFALHYRGR